MAIVQILCNDILPLLFLAFMGYLLDSRFKLELMTYRKVTICVVLPCFIFYSMVQYHPSAASLFLIPAGAVLLLGMAVISRAVSVLLHIDRTKRPVFEAASTYTNAGNIGIALIVFIYTHAPYLTEAGPSYLAEARGTIVLLLIVTNIAVNLFGACQIRTDQVSFRKFFSYMIRMPVLYAVLAGLAVQYTGIELEHTFIWPVFHHFSGAFIVLVTIITGVELHRSQIRKPDLSILASSALRLLISPLLAIAVIALFGCFTPVEAQVFLIAFAAPPSFTVAMYASEYGKHPDFASQAVVAGSLLSIITMTCVIYAARVLYPAV